MKKTLLLAALLAGFAGAAQAQSSLTVYGIIDVGYSSEKNAADSNNERHSTTGQMSGHQSGSRWGLKGSEDLGGGMKGVFQLESGFSADDGKSAQGNRLFGRHAWAGLQTGMGEIRLGRQTSVTSGMFGPVDPFGAGFDRAAAGKVFLSADTVRFDNAITYLSPDFSGFKFGANYSTQINGEEGRTGYNDRWLSTAASFTAGDLYVTATFDRVLVGHKDVAATGTTPAMTIDMDNRDMWSIGATYNLGFVKLHGAYGQMDGCNGVDNSFKGTSYLCGSAAGNLGRNTKEHPDHTSDVWLIGVTAPLGSASKVFASYKSASDWDMTSYSVGYTYDFSKRTNFYTSYNYTENLGRRSGLEPALYAGNTLIREAEKDAEYDQLAVGIRHQF